MKQILIATHGKMASGIRYTAELIVGKMDEITTHLANDFTIQDQETYQSIIDAIQTNMDGATESIKIAYEGQAG